MVRFFLLQEKLIANNLMDFITDDRLLKLPITSLYRIISLYLSSTKSKPDQPIFDFCFKCLDVFGKRASVLFSLFNEIDSNNINILLTKYSTNFDIAFLNHSIMMSFADFVNKKEIIYEQTKQLNDFKKEEEQIINQQLNDFKKEEEQIINQQLNDFKKEEKQIINQQLNDFKKEEKQIINQQLNDFKKEEEQIINQQLNDFKLIIYEEEQKRNQQLKEFKHINY